MTLAEPVSLGAATAGPSAQGAAEELTAPGGGLGQPIVFAGRAAWLHWPSRRRSKNAAGTPGVVLCSAIGRDEGCSHIAIRLLAEALARSGFAVLRYDHLGCGDSLDLPAGAEALPAWREGVELAIECLKARTGVQSVVLGGFRFGASLAIEAAARADGLLLLAPILGCKSWIRELRLRAAFVQAPNGRSDGALESDGLSLSGADLARLQALDLTERRALSQHVLCFSQTPALAAQFESACAGAGGLTLAPFDGYAALLEDPDANQVPNSVLRRAVDWFEQTWPGEPIDGGQMAPERLTTESVLAPPGCRETRLRFGDGLYGVLCLPEQAGGRALLICNTGAEPCRGVGRFSVEVARTMARRGIASLRFDFAGVGDSLLGDGQPPTDVLVTPRDGDIAAAVALLWARGLDRITVFGLCSGACHAVQAVLDNDQIGQAFAVSPPRLAPAPGLSSLVTRGDRGRSIAAYIARACDGSQWGRLLKGDIDLAAVIRTLSLRLKARLQARVDRPRTEALAAKIAALSRRGGRMALLIGADDAALDEVEIHFGPKGERLTRWPGMSLQLEPGLDHAGVLAASRASVLRALTAFMEAPPAS